MTPKNDDNAQAKGFVFPGSFDVTVMGGVSIDLRARVPQILEELGLKVLHETVRHRHSREGNFISVTVRFCCDTRAQYEAAHAALRAEQGVRFTL